MPEGPSVGEMMEYDDILSDLLVDQVFFWSQIHKVGPRYRPLRLSDSEDVVKVLRSYIINERSGMCLEKAVEDLTAMPAIANKMKPYGPVRRNDFCKHTKKYLSVWASDSGYDVCTTARYDRSCSGKTEACIIARRNVKSGDAIRHLTGTTVALTQEQEASFGHDRDFSILHSSRKNKMCLFLGPARFVNHDCKANCKLVLEKNTVRLIATKYISIGHEVTAYYSDSYFGENNCDCLCASCEKEGNGGYSVISSQSTEDSTMALDHIDQDLDTVARRVRKRTQLPTPSDSELLSSEEEGDWEDNKSSSTLSDCDPDCLDAELHTMRTVSQMKSLRLRKPAVSRIEIDKRLVECVNCESWSEISIHQTYWQNACSKCQRNIKLYHAHWPQRATRDPEQDYIDIKQVGYDYSRKIHHDGSKQSSLADVSGATVTPLSPEVLQIFRGFGIAKSIAFS